MSSEKNKGLGTVTRRKTRAGAGADAPSLKQKTLFDSFFLKNAPPKDAAQPSAAAGPTLTVDASVSDATLLVEPLPHNTPTMAIDESAMLVSELVQNASEPIIIDDTLESQPVLAPISHSPKPILIDDDSPSSPSTPPAVHMPTSERDRSPSVVIIEDAMHEPPTAVKAVRAVVKATFKQEGKSADAPIVIESSPIRPLPSSSRPNKPVHPFFGANSKASTPFPLLPKKAAITQHTAQLPTLPGRNSQHIRGTQTYISRYQPVFPTRDISHSSKQAFEPSDYSFLKKTTDASSQTPDKPAYLLSNTVYDSNLNDIPQEHRDNHPAIARVLEYSQDEPLQSRRPWTDKWRPTCAQEVLGNEQSAVYLRNWLQALELQFEENANPVTNESQVSGEGTSKNKAAKRNLKRARVVRAVDKKRKKTRFDSDEEDDSWIVPTDEESEEENVTYESLNDFDDFLTAPPPLSSSPLACPDSSVPASQACKEATKEPDLGQLHNTILLVGPHGVGKTASIYACADELGWEVFEVYPGIGRRNGANVDNLVGEVGKNHLVLQNRHNADPLKSFFQKQKQASHPLIEDTRSGYSPRKRSASSLNFPRETEEPIIARSFRQSLILLEEVDILYKEDSNFWSTVVRIIKECKRPVICTCNDISLIPVEELPLQNVLYFNRPAPEIAVSYLSGLCAAEGRPVQRELVSGLYTAPEQVPNWDLRHDINTLQVLTSTANSLKDIEQSGPNNIGADRPFAGKVLSNRRAETLSFLDGVLHMDSTYHSTMTEMASYGPSEDDEIGHTILYDLHAPATSQAGLYDRHEDILAGLRRHFRDVFDANANEDGTETIDEMAAEMGQVHRRVLGEVCPMAVWARRDAGVALDYIPAVRQMVAADDEGERREAGQRRGGRATRNSSGRSGYIRMIGMTEEGRRVLDASGFGV